ncbi:MAG: response regulator [Phycisphaerae bacterium]|nr:response regulator [Saprospiraceae bacterium]
MSRRLLLVEDHDGLRRIIGNFLSEKFDVVGAKNGLEAMSWLSKGVMPDVIVTDTAMPVLDGAALLFNLRCSGLWADIPVVVLGSGNTDDAAEEQRFKMLGAYGYFAKPFSPTQLQNRLIDIVG